jgi:gamma-glutamylcyclotransferase (GGCT)/AIG2-like uncharacterized protein YtfP
MKHLLFSYGTLQLEKVQIESFGRLLKGNPDRLYQYKLENLMITDATVLEKSQASVHPIAVKSNCAEDFIDGKIFEISEDELKKADDYEVEDYMRVLETFESGLSAWIYVQNTNK